MKPKSTNLLSCREVALVSCHKHFVTATFCLLCRGEGRMSLKSENYMVFSRGARNGQRMEVRQRDEAEQLNRGKLSMSEL